MSAESRSGAQISPIPAPIRTVDLLDRQAEFAASYPALYPAWTPSGWTVLAAALAYIAILVGLLYSAPMA